MNVDEHRARWMRMCITSNGDVDFLAYRALTTAVPLRDFMDLEELALCEKDRKLGFELFIGRKENADLFGDEG